MSEERERSNSFIHSLIYSLCFDYRPLIITWILKYVRSTLPYRFPRDWTVRGPACNVHEARVGSEWKPLDFSMEDNDNFI